MRVVSLVAVFAVARVAAAEPAARPVEGAVHVGVALVAVASEVTFDSAAPWAELEVGHRFGRVSIAGFGGFTSLSYEDRFAGQAATVYLGSFGARAHVHVAGGFFGIGALVERWHEDGHYTDLKPGPYSGDSVLFGGEVHAGYTFRRIRGVALEVLTMGARTIDLGSSPMSSIGERGSWSLRLAVGARM
jgi:hypothetical protein